MALLMMIGSGMLIVSDLEMTYPEAKSTDIGLSWKRQKVLVIKNSELLFSFTSLAFCLGEDKSLWFCHSAYGIYCVF